MYKKYFIFAIALSIFHFAFLTNVSAHILKTDGTIGAVMHMDPEDDPIAGIPTNFFWDFKDTGGQFTKENCICVMTVFKDNEKVANVRLIGDAATYTFTKRGMYKIQVSGAPLSDATFQPFTLSYDVRVEREALNEDKTDILSRLLLGGIILAIGTIIIIGLWKRKKL